jgi:hypothetical protein
LSFLFTTPGVVATHAAGLPVLSAQPGQFLLKDLVLIGVSLWTLGDSLTAAGFGRRRGPSEASRGELAQPSPIDSSVVSGSTASPMPQRI